MRWSSFHYNFIKIRIRSVDFSKKKKLCGVYRKFLTGSEISEGGCSDAVADDEHNDDGDDDVPTFTKARGVVMRETLKRVPLI